MSKIARFPLLPLAVSHRSLSARNSTKRKPFTSHFITSARGTPCLNERKRLLAYTISPPRKVFGVNTSLTCLSHLSTSPPPPRPLPLASNPPPPPPQPRSEQGEGVGKGRRGGGGYSSCEGEGRFRMCEGEWDDSNYEWERGEGGFRQGGGRVISRVGSRPY